MIRERWTEENVLAFATESDNFERKCGLDLKSEVFSKNLAKALSAFANSNGGHIVIGLNDDGTVAGIEPIVKGTTAVDEWLSQKVADLLAPALRDFRVHLVLPAPLSSRIPPGRVLAVIDVESSEFAPHQSVKELVYYYRVDKQSRPAPHRYIESLFIRQRFPGPNVAGAWVYSVINPLLNSLRGEQHLLQSGVLGFDRHRPGKLGSVSRVLDRPASANYEQFFLYKREIDHQLVEHDLLVGELIDEVFQAHAAITRKELQEGLYANITMPEMLAPLKDGNRSTAPFKFAPCHTREDYVKLLFSEDDAAENTRSLVEFMINRRRSGEDFTFSPLWNLYREELLDRLARIHGEQLQQISQRAFAVNQSIERAIEMLKRERERLCVKYGLPFEDHNS